MKTISAAIVTVATANCTKLERRQQEHDSAARASSRRKEVCGLGWGEHTNHTLLLQSDDLVRGYCSGSARFNERSWNGPATDRAQPSFSRVAIAERITKIPAQADHNNFVTKMSAPEQHRSTLSLTPHPTRSPYRSASILPLKAFVWSKCV